MRRPSVNGSAPPPVPRVPRRRRLHTRTSGIPTALIAAAALIVVLIFIIQDVHAVNISFLGAHCGCRWPWRCCPPPSRARW